MYEPSRRELGLSCAAVITDDECCVSQLNSSFQPPSLDRWEQKLSVHADARRAASCLDGLYPASIPSTLDKACWMHYSKVDQADLSFRSTAWPRSFQHALQAHELNLCAYTVQLGDLREHNMLLTSPSAARQLSYQADLRLPSATSASLLLRHLRDGGT